MVSNRNNILRVGFLTIGTAFIAFICLQFIRPVITNPPVTADLQAPAEVKQILRNSCYNCHSNETKLPWFDKIVPAYWLVASDVKHARMHLNFSEIATQPAVKQKGILYEAVNQIQLGAMPLPAYVQVHPEAKITAAQLAILRAYLDTNSDPHTAPHSPPQPMDTAAADAQYTRWISSETTHSEVQPEFNGVKFLPDYKNWKAISSTDRFDNNTMRVILGNDVAVQAIADSNINPWPEGTAFAKVAWQQQPDGHGNITTGAFIQVELMIRDSKVYASTKGWGWGRWRGTDLKPYGTSASFTKECVSCHEPVKHNDYVYTTPIRGQK
jgi:hypothetical protein